MATSTAKTQLQRVLSKLQSGQSLTSAQARSWGIQRLPARIHELREEMELNIVSTPYTNRDGNRSVKYSLATNSKQNQNTRSNLVSRSSR